VVFRFGDHVPDIERRKLRRGAEPVALEPQVFDLLVYLVRNRGRVVRKDDLIQSICTPDRLGRQQENTPCRRRCSAAGVPPRPRNRVPRAWERGPDRRARRPSRQRRRLPTGTSRRLQRCSRAALCRTDSRGRSTRDQSRRHSADATRTVTAEDATLFRPTLAEVFQISVFASRLAPETINRISTARRKFTSLMRR
jgi:hypothetical protein